MEEVDTGQEMQKTLEIKCEVEWHEGNEEETRLEEPMTSTIAIKREIEGECYVKTEMEDGSLPSNPLMVAANQFHNLKVQFYPRFHHFVKKKMQIISGY